jgi:hypothetical protein
MDCPAKINIRPDESYLFEFKVDLYVSGRSYGGVSRTIPMAADGVTNGFVDPVDDGGLTGPSFSKT